MTINPYNNENGNNKTRNDRRKNALKFILFADDAIISKISNHNLHKLFCYNRDLISIDLACCCTTSFVMYFIKGIEAIFG